MIWIGFLVMILTIVVSAATLRNSRGDALGIPLVALGSFTFLYVVQPLQLIRSGTAELFLTDWQITKALLVAALMLAFFMWGWLHSSRTRVQLSISWDPQSMWRFGFAAACIGLILYVIFLERSGGFVHSYSRGHGEAMAWTDNTAYIYDGPWLMLSGAVMMILAKQGSLSRKWKTLVPYCFLGAFLANAIMGGDRGPLFAVASATFVGFSIARRKQVNLKQAAGVLFVVGCLIAVVFANREQIHLGANDVSNSTHAAPEMLNDLVGTSEYDQEHGEASQEFLFHASVLETVDQTGKLDWGRGWVEFFFINPIPRLLWPAKPNADWYGISNGDIYEQTSIAISPGSAPGIVADLYERFHLLSVLFLFGLGFGLRRLFVLARNFSSPLTTVGYVMVYALSLNIFAQGFGALFVPFCYSMIPVMLFAWLTLWKRQKALRRQRDVFLRKIAGVHGEQWSS
ncbi:MAG: hypothetical protein ACLPY1_02250 [Terracidiphilus sp.]